VIRAGDIRSEGLYLFFAFLAGFGGGLGSMVVAAWGCNGAYAQAAGVSMVAAVALLLRQPGHPGNRTRTAQPRATG
jgi:hypothetical protein